MVGSVGYVLGVVCLDEAEGPVVDSDAEHAHVVSVEHSVSEADPLPRHYQVRREARHTTQECEDFVLRAGVNVREMFL